MTAEAEALVVFIFFKILFNIDKEAIIMNQITLVGNLTRDPEMRNTQSGIHVCHFTLAVNRRYKNPQDPHKADFFDVVAWRQTGELCQRYLRKGSKAVVRGVLQRCSYRMSDGPVRNDVEIVADEVEFLMPARQNNAPYTNTTLSYAQNAAANAQSAEKPAFYPDYDAVIPIEEMYPGYKEYEDEESPF